MNFIKFIFKLLEYLNSLNELPRKARHYNDDILIPACPYTGEIPISRHSLVVNSTGELRKKQMQ